MMGPIHAIALVLVSLFGARRLALALLPGEQTAAIGLATAVFAWTWMTLGVQVLGALGVFRLEFVYPWTLSLPIVSLVFSRRARASLLPQTDPQTRGLDVPATLAVGLTVWAGLWFGLPSLLGPVKVVSDGPIYHLYFAARWAREGRLFLIAAPFGETAAPYFPAGGDVWFSWLILAWGDETLAKVGQAPFWALSGITVVATAMRLGAKRSSAVIACAWFLLCTPMVLFSFEANVDTIFVCGYLLSVYFVIAWSNCVENRALLVTGMLALGLALGTKPTAIVFVPTVLAAAAAVAWQKRKSPRFFLASLAIIAAVPLIPAGYWFVRNLALTGNPLYPLHLEAGGRAILRGWYVRTAMERSPYYIPLVRVRALGDTLLAVLDPRLAPVWLFAVGAGLWVRGDRGRPRAWIATLSLLTLINIAIYWILIPYRTQQRFMLQAFGLAAVPLSLVWDRSSAARTVATIVLVLHVLTPQGWPLVLDPRVQAPWDLDPMIPNRLPALVPLVSSRGLVDRAWQIGIVAMISVAVRAWVQRRSRLDGFAAFLACVVLGSAAVVSNDPAVRDPMRKFYPESFPDYYRGWRALDRLAGPKGAVIAYAGTDLPYYPLGAGLRNKVRYININQHKDWLMHDYARASRRRLWPDPRPGWDRDPAEASYEAWVANLDAAGVELLAVTRANPAEGAFNPTAPDGFTIERRWADAHPERFALAYPREFPDPLFRIYRVARPAR